MRAVVQERYGSLVVRELEKPTPAEGEVLVRVHATSLNAADWYGFAGRPFVARAIMGLRRPRTPEIGIDFAGVVAGLGPGSTDFVPGDEVYGCEGGAFAEYVTARKAIDHKPTNLSLTEAATVPIAGLTALQGLRDHGGVHAGQKVLVNGGSGGVGTFAIQIAKALGAETHVVCSTRNVQQAHELGADRVFDYAREDFARSGQRYDVLFDNAGNRSWRSMRRVLAPDGTAVLVGGPRRRLFGPLGHVARVKLASILGGRKAVFFIAKPNRDDLATLRGLIERGDVRPVIERGYELAQIDDAMRAMDGHARAKIVVSLA